MDNIHRKKQKQLLAAICIVGVALTWARTDAECQPIRTEFGEWQYLEHRSALETAKWLLLYGQTEQGTSWIIGRKCGTNHRVLMAHVASQGDAADIGMAVKRRDCVVNLNTTAGCDRYADTIRYKTRYRIDDNDISWVNWYYGFDSNAGIETLSVMTYDRHSGNLVPSRPDIMDRLVSGDRLAVEISPARGVATFNTTGYSDAVAKYCQEA